MKKSYQLTCRQYLLIFALLSLIPWRLSAQQAREVKGTVMEDGTDISLPGVIVKVKGADIGASTDEKGEFTLQNIPANAVLVFSFIGYQPLEVNADRSPLHVKLRRDIHSLDNVVVIGYGTQSKRNVTGSIAKVDMADMEDLPTTNVSQALRGRVAGVQFTDDGRPGQGGTILIRGQRSISANNDPLIVLDGIIFEGSLSDINPGDIESMDILKDAASTAIYGSRAANGVILITSKKGTTETPTIRFSAYYGVSSWSHRPKLLSPERYIGRLLDFRKQSNLSADPAEVADYLTPTEAENYIAGKTIDPWEVVSQSASVQNYEVSISGRTEKTNYFISGGYNNDKGLVYNDNAKRITTRVNLSTQIRDWLKIGTNVMFSERDLSGVESDVSTAIKTSPFATIWLDDAHTDPNPMPTEDALIGSINFESVTTKNKEFQRNLFANFYAIVDLPFVNGLSYRINYSPNYRWSNVDNFIPIYRRNGQDIKGSASRQSENTQAWVLENILTYTRQIGEDHHFDVTLLYGRNKDYGQSMTATGFDFTGTSDANTWNNLSLAKIQTTASSDYLVNLISSMARVNYRFKERYMITLTARRDGSSVFGSNNKYGTFPSAAIAWIASDESFIKDISTIDMLKFRASYGSVGNQAIKPYQSLTKQNQTQYVYGDGGSTSIGLFPANLANPDLGWETTTTANIAVDFGLWQGKIAGTLEFYNMDTKDLLLTRQLPFPTGFESMLTNVGATNNKGIEVTINSVNISRPKLEWSTSFVFSTNRNRIVHLYNSDANGDGKEDNDIANSWFIGKPISVGYDYKVIGVYQVDDKIPVGQEAGFLRMADANGDGEINADDRIVLGTLEPKYRFGLTNNLTYGNFNFSLTINAMTGWIANNLMLTLDDATHGQGTYPGRENFLDEGWWTDDNRSNTRSSLVYTNPYNHGYYQSRDFLRIQEAAISFEFPKPIVERLKVSSLKAYVSGRNLYTFTAWKGFDPETGTSLYPVARTVSFGFNASF